MRTIKIVFGIVISIVFIIAFMFRQRSEGANRFCTDIMDLLVGRQHPRINHSKSCAVRESDTITLRIEEIE